MFAWRVAAVSTTYISPPRIERPPSRSSGAPIIFAEARADSMCGFCPRTRARAGSATPVRRSYRSYRDAPYHALPIQWPWLRATRRSTWRTHRAFSMILAPCEMARIRMNAAAIAVECTSARSAFRWACPVPSLPRHVRPATAFWRSEFFPLYAEKLPDRRLHRRAGAAAVRGVSGERLAASCLVLGADEHKLARMISGKQTPSVAPRAGVRGAEDAYEKPRRARRSHLRHTV
jgi:hypothetical protein